jgi:hypothetical protein
MDASTQISRKACRPVAGSESLWDILERVMCKALRIKLRLHWRPLEVTDPRNVECPSTRECSCGLSRDGLRSGLPKSFSAHIMLLCAPNASCGATEINACHADFALVWPYSC